MAEMDEVDQLQQKEIGALQSQDRIHTLYLKLISIFLFGLLLLFTVMMHIIISQKISIEGLPCIEKELNDVAQSK